MKWSYLIRVNENNISEESRSCTNKNPPYDELLNPTCGRKAHKDPKATGSTAKETPYWWSSGLHVKVKGMIWNNVVVTLLAVRKAMNNKSLSWTTSKKLSFVHPLYDKDASFFENLLRSTLALVLWHVFTVTSGMSCPPNQSKYMFQWAQTWLQSNEIIPVSFWDHNQFVTNFLQKSLKCEESALVRWIQFGLHNTVNASNLTGCLENFMSKVPCRWRCIYICCLYTVGVERDSKEISSVTKP